MAKEYKPLGRNKILSSTYTYEFADGTRLTLKAGEQGVTEADIHELIRADNREVYNNYRNWGPAPSEKEREERKEQEKRNPGSTASRSWNASLSACSSEEGRSLEEEKEMMDPWGRKSGVSDDVLTLLDAIGKLPLEQQLMIRAWVAGYTFAEIAERIHKDKSTVSRRIKVIEKNIKKIFEE